MIVIGAIGFKYGSPERLVYGTDYTGKVCGMDTRSSTKYTVYPRLQQDFFLNLAKASPLDYTFYGVCVSSCPGAVSLLRNGSWIQRYVLKSVVLQLVCLIFSLLFSFIT